MTENLIEKHVLINAYKFGKADQGRIIGKIIGENPDLKAKMKEIIPLIRSHVDKANSMKKEEIENILKTKYPDFDSQPRKEKKQGLKELKNAEKGVIMRFAPSPSGPMHLGHAMTGGLTSLYTKKYNGKFILRIEDTNSNNIYPPAYDMLPEDGNWLFGNITEIWIQSDRLEIYYSYVKKLLEKEAAYVCTCSQDQFKNYSLNKEECPCRNLEDQKSRWDSMFDKENGFKEGEAVLRFKSDMKHRNPAMRDFPLARINDSEHPRKGTEYRVWPLMNLSVTVDDIEAGMTHIIRAKDHTDNAKRQELIYKVLNKPVPETYFVGRINFEGLELSASKTKEKIQEKIYTGWDDIRLPFIGALKRRGYQPGAFMKYTENIGISLVDKTVSAEEFYKALNAYNKEIIDPIAKRFFFVNDPIEISIKDAPEKDITLDLHPETEKGGRRFLSSDKFLISEDDYSNIEKEKLYRLMDCINFRKQEDGFIFDSEDIDTYRKEGKSIIHWLTSENNVPATVVMPDNSKKEGMAEKTITDLKKGDIIQFERFGFCRLDEIKDGRYIFWFAHR